MKTIAVFRSRAFATPPTIVAIIATNLIAVAPRINSVANKALALARHTLVITTPIALTAATK